MTFCIFELKILLQLCQRSHHVHKKISVSSDGQFVKFVIISRKIEIKQTEGGEDLYKK